MDGWEIVATIISFQLSQTAIILYKIGRIEALLDEYNRRIRRLEILAGLNGAHN